MPNWNQLLGEINTAGSTHDVVRRKYIETLSGITGRNTIIYYSGWLQKASLASEGMSLAIDDGDKNGFMSTIHQLDRSKGLDLVLHTPGGGTAATESIVDYLRSMFGTDIRAIIPQLAMSAGTMIALSCKEIIMGKHSSLGPIDPQLAGVPAHGLIEEFNRARNEVFANPAAAMIWQPILAKYPPSLVGEAQKAIDWSTEMVKEWLQSGMFAGDPQAQGRADRVVSEFGDHAITKSHDRHISMVKASGLGLKITALEDQPDLQDAVLSVHHACLHTFAATPAYKIIENHKGIAFVQQAQRVVLARA